MNLLNHHSVVVAVSATVLSLAGALPGGCTNQVVQAAGPGGPVAVLVCLDRVEPGVAFDVDGSGSHDVDGALASTLLSLPGQEVSALSGSFTVAAAGIATARLVVVDEDGLAAEARCRIQVGDVADAVLPEAPEEPVEPVEPGDEAPVEEPRVPGAPVDLTGTFALVAFDAPVLSGSLAMSPARQCATAPTVSLVRLVQTGRHVSMTATTCSLTMPTVNMMLVGAQRTTAPDSFVDALPALTAEFDLAHGEVGDRFAPLPTGGAQVVGAVVTVDDALPTDPADARATDDDADGAMGVRIASSAGDQQIAWRRFVDGFDGVIASGDVIDGSVPGSYQATAESTLLSFSLFDFLVPGGAGLPSTFQMTRTTDQSCAEVRAHLEAIIAAAVPPALPADCPAF